MVSDALSLFEAGLKNSLKELRSGFDCLKNGKRVPHHYVSDRLYKRYAGRVISVANGDSPDEGCPPRATEVPWPTAEAAFTLLKQRNLAGQPESQFVSITIDMVWMLYFAAKSILVKKQQNAIMVEIDLEAYDKRKPNKLLDLSTYRSATANGLSLWGEKGLWATGASEVLTCGIDALDLTGQYWCLDRNTDAGLELLELAGSDREINGDGSVKVFGCFLQWFNAYHAKYSKAGEKKLFDALRLRARQSAIVEAGTTRKRKPTAAMVTSNEQAAAATFDEAASKVHKQKKGKSGKSRRIR